MGASESILHHIAVSYINCSAAVKALSDLICTSSNAVDLVKQLPADRPILFAPDQNLGRWVQRQSGRQLTLWPGSCIVHETFSEQALLRRAEASPASSFIVLTEPGILHQMRLKVPGKSFYEVPSSDGCSCNACPYMRLNTLKKCGSASI